VIGLFCGQFSRIDVLLVSKSDLLPHLDFDVVRVVQECRDLNAHVEAFALSSRTGEGRDAFYAHLVAAMAKVRAGR
jgi:hydrogenase nickel incorporation protein HypB